MIDDSITTSQLIRFLLSDGWEWTKSDDPNYMLLSKNGFEWKLPPFFTMYDLLQMLLQRGEK